MNYRHGYHAGNFADVVKHVVLVGLLDTLHAKAAPFCCIDTHAGRGDYALDGIEALKTGEFRDGIDRLAGADGQPALLQRYLDVVDAIRGGDRGRYPGSPKITQHLLRADDRAILCELEPGEAAALRTLLRDDPRCAVHQRDGYAALKALLPPPQRRGLVLIDPPFEAQDDEFRVIEAALETIRARWATATVAVWYPVKQAAAITPFHRWLATTHAGGNVLVAESMIHPADSPLRLNGCGMAIINAPWRFDEALQPALAELTRRLGDDPGRSSRLQWLAQN